MYANSTREALSWEEQHVLYMHCCCCKTPSRNDVIRSTPRSVGENIIKHRGASGRGSNRRPGSTTRNSLVSISTVAGETIATEQRDLAGNAFGRPLVVPLLLCTHRRRQQNGISKRPFSSYCTHVCTFRTHSARVLSSDPDRMYSFATHQQGYVYNLKCYCSCLCCWIYILCSTFCL